MDRIEKKQPSPIDKVTTAELDVALRIFGIKLDVATVDIIIDVVELMEQKGGETTLFDLCKLKSELEENNSPIN